MSSGVRPRTDSTVSETERSPLTSIEEDDTPETPDYTSGHLTLHQSLDSFFQDSPKKEKPLPKEKKLFQKLLDEHNELKRDVAILKLRNCQLEQTVEGLYGLVVRMAYAPPPPPPQFYPPSNHYHSHTFNMDPPPFYPSPFDHPSPPRPDSPTDFDRKN